MDTEKAIEFITLGLQYAESIDEKTIINKIIELLHRGEKFEKLYREIRMKFKILHTDFESGEKYYTGVLNEGDIKEIEQKYFPEGL